MKRLFPFAVLGALAFGCQKAPEVEPPPEIEALLDAAWAKYRAGDFAGAEATFDSVITVDAYLPEAYVGKGYSCSQVSNYSDAYGAFSIVLILAEPAFSEPIPITDTLNTITFDTSQFSTYIDTSWYHTVAFNGVGVWKLKVTYPGYLLGFTKVTHGKLEVDVVGFDDQWVYICSDMPFYYNGAWTDTAESFTYYYKYMKTTPIHQDIWFSIYGMGLAYLAEKSDLNSAYIYLTGALSGLNNYSGSSNPRVPQSITATDSQTVYSILAYTLFKYGLNANAVDVLHKMDPGFPYSGWDIKVDTCFLWAFDPNNYKTILKKIEGGL
ncbi:MAG: hypothetical protein ABIM88_05320 [candidate division WOR-3 bacterium]